MKKFTSRFSPFVIAALLALVATRNAQAVDVFWNVALGDWDVDANWSTGLQPATGDNAIVNNAGTASVTTDESANALNQILVHGNSTISLDGGVLSHFGTGGNDVKIGNAGGGTGTLTINEGTANFNTNAPTSDSWTFFGVDGGTGFLNMNGGAINVGGSRFVFGQNGGATGTGVQNAGAVNYREMRVGTDDGVGSYTFNDGTMTGTADMHVGIDRGTGAFTNNNTGIAGVATLNVNNSMHIGAWGGSATLDNNGDGLLPGMLRVGNELRIGMGRNANGQGTGTILPGNVGIINARHVSIGRDGGKGTVTMDQATDRITTTAEFWVGSGRGDGPTHGSNGEFNISAGEVQSNGDLMLAHGGGPLANARGTINQSGGLVNNVGWINVGRDGISNKGIYNISGGTLSQPAGNDRRLNIGWGAKGEVNHTGGTIDVNQIWNGSGSQGGVGVLNTPGTNGLFGTTFNVAGQFGTGQGGGFGTTNQSAGGTISASEIHIGADPGSTGIYNLGDENGPAELISRGASFIGRDGAVLGQLNMVPGSIFQSNGENFIGHSMSGYGEVNNDGGFYRVTGNGVVNIGRDLADGTYNGSNGATFTASSEVRVGTWGSTGIFNNNPGAGDVSVGGELRVGMFDNHRGRGNGTFNALSGNVTVGSWLSVGRDGGIGEFNQDNENGVGVVTATNVQIGRAPGDGQRSGGEGVYNLKSGTLNVTETGDAGGPGRLSIGTDTNGFTNQGSGLFKMTGGALNVVGRTSVGWNGGGIYDQSSGVAVHNDVWVGSHDDGVSTGVGLFKMSGDGAFTSNIMMLGRGGTGGGIATFSMADAATGQINDRMSVGVEPGATGTYNQSGGLLNINNSVTVGEQNDFGRGPATGHYIQSGGETRMGRGLIIAQNGAVGDYVQSGGKTIFGGANDAGNNPDSLIVGSNTSTGTVTITGGELTQAQSVSGDGGWNRIGTGNNGVGNFNLSGTGIVTLRGRTHLGSGGNSIGTVTQTGGTFALLGPAGGGNGEMVLGDGDSTGNYNISGGSLSVGTNLFVGH